MKMVILLTLIIFVTGCGSTAPPLGSLQDVPVAFDHYDSDRVKKRSEELGMRTVDYLHYVNNREIQPQKVVFYQAYDSNWDDPSINPVFENEWEAKEYAKRNNMATDEWNTGHSYIVRVVDYRYEVRQENEDINHLMDTFLMLEDAKSYAKQYIDNHHGLVVYDLTTGNKLNLEE
mgnify:FL=1